MPVLTRSRKGEGASCMKQRSNKTTESRWANLPAAQGQAVNPLRFSVVDMTVSRVVHSEKGC